MGPEEFDRYVELVAAARAEFAGRVDVRLGLESDYFPGIEAWAEKLHARVPLHHVLGSVHMQVTHYKARYFTGDVFAYQQLYFEHLAESAETGLFDTLAHPDLVKNEAPDAWEFNRIRPFIERALDRIARTGVAMEINTSGLNKALPEMNPGPLMLRMMRERNIPVVIGADAHRPTRVGDRYEEALTRLENAGYQHVSLFLDRQRQDIPIAVARPRCAPHRSRPPAKAPWPPLGRFRCTTSRGRNCACSSYAGIFPPCMRRGCGTTSTSSAPTRSPRCPNCRRGCTRALPPRPHSRCRPSRPRRIRRTGLPGNISSASADGHRIETVLMRFSRSRNGVHQFAGWLRDGLRVLRHWADGLHAAPHSG
jgi:histidinol-phosphatase (PHP family)